MLKSLGASLMAELKVDISENRKLTETFENIVNKAPLTAREGQRLGLIDGTMYLTQLEKQLKDEGAEHFVNLQDYAATLSHNDGNLPTIAVLNLNGEIIDGKSRDNISLLLLLVKHIFHFYIQFSIHGVF